MIGPFFYVFSHRNFMERPAKQKNSAPPQIPKRPRPGPANGEHSPLPHRLPANVGRVQHEAGEATTEDAEDERERETDEREHAGSMPPQTPGPSPTLTDPPRPSTPPQIDCTINNQTRGDTVVPGE